MAGAYEKQIGDVIVEITFLDEDLHIKTINKGNAKFSYRHSIFQEKNWIIISAKIKLYKGNKEEISKKMEEYLSARRSKQPLNMPSAGSVFKREKDFFAAKIIEDCGLKGYNIGDAEVSSKHAGFIVNKGNATAKDILELINIVKQKVKDKFNKELEIEIRIIGEE